MHVIFTNGPPGSGKDTLGELVIRRLLKRYGWAKVIHARIKDVLYRATYRSHNLELHGMSYDDWVTLCNDRVLKEEPSVLLGGMSPRQALIYESENVIKVRHGNNGVAIQRVELLEEEHGDLSNAMVVFTDGGFTAEVETIVERLRLDRAVNVTLVRVLRKGMNFRKDSRHYIANPDIVVCNDYTIEALEVWTTLVLDRVATQRGGFILLPKATIRESMCAVWATTQKLMMQDIGFREVFRTFNDLTGFLVMSRGA